MASALPLGILDPVPGYVASEILLLALAGALLLQALLWGVHLVTRNAAWVDFGWAASLATLPVVYALLSPAEGFRPALVAALPALAFGRLALHLLRDRLLGAPEEGRYVRLRRALGARAPFLFLPFFLAQALLAVFLSLPFLLAVHPDHAAPLALDVAGTSLGALALLLEGLADRQLSRFKADPENRGKVMDRGLWAWSRHPNYFFQWLLWIAYGLLALSAPDGWLAFLPALVMLVLVLFVTGIPPTEKQAVSSRGEAYRAYQRQTSPFVPWPPKGRA